MTSSIQVELSFEDLGLNLGDFTELREATDSLALPRSSVPAIGGLLSSDDDGTGFLLTDFISILVTHVVHVRSVFVEQSLHLLDLFDGDVSLLLATASGLSEVSGFIRLFATHKFN